MQWYVNVPALLIVTALSCALNAAILPESNIPSNVAVCSMESRLCQFTTWPTRMICGLGEYDELPRSPLMLIVKSMPGPCGLVAPGGVEGLVELDPHPSPSARIAVAEQSRMSRVMKTIGASADPFSERT